MEVESETTVRKRSRETEKTQNPPSYEKKRNGGILKYLIEHYPWVLTMWLIPLSVFYDMFSWVQTQVTYWANKKKSSLRHEAKVLYGTTLKSRMTVGNGFGPAMRTGSSR